MEIIIIFYEISESPFIQDVMPQRDRITGGSTRKKKKMSELKAFVETKLKSRSEKALEKIGNESRRSSVFEDPVRNFILKSNYFHFLVVVF